MEEEVQKIWTLSKADRIQNVDYAIGVELTNLYSLMKEDPSSIPQNFEDLILALIVINKGQISITNAHLIALICVFYYKRQNPPNYWRLIPVLTEEVKKLRRPSIYILGLLSRLLCDGFKSQLPMPIQYLLKVNDETLFPLICQCFRRIIKGTGTFLIQQIPDIFGFIFAGSSSTNELIRIESVKSIPTLLEYAHISIKKLLPIVGQLLSYTTKEMRYAAAKSLAKLIYIGAKSDSNPDGKRGNDNIAETIIRDTNKEQDENEKSKESGSDSNLNPFKYGFKIILQFAQNDKNAETLALTLHILLRFYQPIEIVKKLRTFTNFILCLPSMKLPLQSIIYLSNGIIKAVISVVGSTIGNSICYHLIESIKNSEGDKNRRSIENFNYTAEQKAMIALTALIHFDASTKIVATAAKQFYPLLSSGRKDIQKVCIAFFAKIGQKEENLGRIFIDTFSSFLATVDDSRINDIDGFSKAAASIIVSIESSGKSVPDASIEKVKKVVTSFLTEKNYSTMKMAMSYLLLAALAKGRKGYDMIPFVFNFTQAYLKCLPNKPVDRFMKKTIKCLSIYFLQIIENQPSHFEKLKSTIRGFVLIILPNVEILSKSGLYLFLRLTKSWFELNPSTNDKINDFIVRSYAKLFTSSFEKATRQSLANTAAPQSGACIEKQHLCSLNNLSASLATVDNDVCSIFSADIGGYLYNFETPSNSHASHIDVLSLVEIFGLKPPKSNNEFRSSDDFLLLDIPFWASKCTSSALNEVVAPLFDYTKQDVPQIVCKLKLLSALLKSRRDLGLSKSHFDKLIGLEQATRVASNAASKTQESRNMQIQFALAEAVSLWFISHSTFSDAKLVSNSDLSLLMNAKNKFFSSLLIAFTCDYLHEEIQVQALLFLMQNIQARGDSVMLFAFRRLLSSFRLMSDFSAQIGNFLEYLSYSNVLLSKPSLIKEFTRCVLSVSARLNHVQTIRIVQNLLHFPVNSNYAQLNGLLITSTLKMQTGNLSPLFDCQSEIDLTLQKPLPILMASFSSRKVIIPTLDDVPLLFMMLQQFTSLNLRGVSDSIFSMNMNLNEEVINDCILTVFHADCNVKKWTNFAKRIVIIGCVPPAERKGDIRILPTSSVLICAIKIAVLLVQQIRSNMELRCVDDIVSIAFTAIHMEDKRIDLHCYSILSSVIECFADVRNQEGSLLDVYFSQFHPTFTHAFDEGKRELQSVAPFVIAYFRYIESNRKNLLDEVSAILVEGLKKMKFDNDSLIVFCRVSSLVNHSNDSDFDDMFIQASSSFLRDVLIQKRLLIELKEELPNFISKYQSIQKVHKNDKVEFIPNRILLALLLSELSISCDSIYLNAVTNTAEIANDKEAADFVLRRIGSSNLLIEEADEERRIRAAVRENEERQKDSFNSINSSKREEVVVKQKSDKNLSDGFDNENFDVVDDDLIDNDIEQTAFWVFPVKKPSSVNRFLMKITNEGQIGELFEPILSLSLSPPICFGAVCNVLRMSSKIASSTRFATLISSTVLNDEVNDECLALFQFMFGHLSNDVIDNIVEILMMNDRIPNEKRFEILRYAFTKLNGFEFHSIETVVSFLSNFEVLLPDGINFVGSLLVSPKTALTGIYILQSGLLTPIATATVSPLGMRILPRILHFFNTALIIVRKICDREDLKSFSILASRVALVALAQVAGVKEKAAVVKPACLLIKNIDREVLAGVFNSGRLRKKAIMSVKPQKQAEAIQLLTFADVSNRKSNNGGWQSLDVESDDD
ncbi:hypothetical protein M9Y10_015196 [Tritrichomonas musculus]|uniref:HEAT repeat family protein n=1 Tax=Tritrichomonas musculus TaxID=1915356 RepID=A0ABR2L3E1_9EUKA